jgi:hypothetical protein
MSRDPFALREGPPPSPHRRIVLGVLLALAIAALAVKLAGIPPFSHFTASSAAVVSEPASTAAPAAPGSQQPQGSEPVQTPPGTILPAPTGQWLATGRVHGTLGVANVPVGEVVVQAWSFRNVCGEYQCNTDLTRHPGDGPATAKLTTFPGGLQGTFPPYSVACVEGSDNRVVPHARGSERDEFLFNWTAHQHELTGQENGGIVGCGSTLANITINWTATKVPGLEAPAIPISSHHVGSASAFVAAATQVCARVNADIEPLTATIESDQQTIDARRGVAVAEAATSLAETLPKLIPLAVRIYSEIPQPPEPLDVLWIRAVQIEQNALAPSMSYMAATAREMNALSRYVLTEDNVQAQDAAAEAALANQDASAIPSHDALIGPIERQLNLPSSCTNLPAYSAAMKATAA